MHMPKQQGSLRLVSANVCTLRPGQFRRAIGEKGLAHTSRIATLERAFNEAKYDIVGVQESRIQGDLELRGEHYNMLSSSATTTGASGVQLWIRNTVGA